MLAKNLADISYIKENFKLCPIRYVCTLYAGAGGGGRGSKSVFSHQSKSTVLLKAGILGIMTGYLYKAANKDKSNTVMN